MMRIDRQAGDPGSAPLDVKAFREMYPALRRFAGAVAPSTLEPDDLVQEALTSLLRRSPDAPPVLSPAAYLRTAILNAARSSHRRGRRGFDMVDLDGADAVAAFLPTYPSDLGVLDALAPADRALLYLTAVESWTYAEVAVLLGQPEASLRMRATRLRRSLRALLEAPDDAPDDEGARTRG